MSVTISQVHQLALPAQCRTTEVQCTTDLPPKHITSAILIAVNFRILIGSSLTTKGVLTYLTCMMVMSHDRDIHNKRIVGGNLPVFMTLTDNLITEHIKVNLRRTIEGLIASTRGPRIITWHHQVGNLMMDGHLLGKSPGVFYLTHSSCILNFLMDSRRV